MSEIEIVEQEKDTSKMRWFVLQAFSGFEARVAMTLREYIKLHNMQDQFGEVLVPTEEVVDGGWGAGKELKIIVKTLTRSSKNEFYRRLHSWFIKHQAFFKRKKV
ncbi:hypothetical protein HPS12939_1292 [Glaesserella parasuis 12939]|nr:hypothetical protein HPS12939_1292 [Glaesserella parasuis 12939]